MPVNRPSQPNSSPGSSHGSPVTKESSVRFSVEKASKLMRLTARNAAGRMNSRPRQGCPPPSSSRRASSVRNGATGTAHRERKSARQMRVIKNRYCSMGASFSHRCF